MILTCPTCRQRSRHPPNAMLGRWAICPHCGGEIDWRQHAPSEHTLALTNDPFATPKDKQENDR